jgi:FixJ family two-component response regulator
VLVVDDARSIRDFITDYILAPRGYEILTASDGLQGLRLAFDKRPDLMIVDVQMPTMDGLEMLRRLQLRRITVPAILITAHSSEKVAIEALRMGVRDYVLKPFDVKEMEDAIDRALRESRLVGAHGELQQQMEEQERSLRRFAQQVNGLYSVGRLLSTTTDLDAALQRVIEAAAFLCGANESSLFLLDGERGELVMRAAHKTALSADPVAVNSTPAAHALRTLETTVLDSKAIQRLMPDGPPLGQLAYVPLVAHGQPVGVLSVATHSGAQSFSQRDQRLLAILAALAAQIIASSAPTERGQPAGQTPATT